MLIARAIMMFPVVIVSWGGYVVLVFYIECKIFECGSTMQCFFSNCLWMTICKAFACDYACRGRWGWFEGRAHDS